MVTIRQIVKDAAKRRPVEADANPEAIRAAVEVVTKFLVAASGIVPTVIVTVNEKGHLALFLVLTMSQCRKLVGGPRQQLRESISGNILPIIEVIEWPLVADKVFERALVAGGHAILDGAISNHPIRRHDGTFRLSASNGKQIGARITTWINTKLFSCYLPADFESVGMDAEMRRDVFEFLARVDVVAESKPALGGFQVDASCHLCAGCFPIEAAVNCPVHLRRPWLPALCDLFPISTAPFFPVCSAACSRRKHPYGNQHTRVRGCLFSRQPRWLLRQMVRLCYLYLDFSPYFTPTVLGESLLPQHLETFTTKPLKATFRSPFEPKWFFQIT